MVTLETCDNERAAVLAMKALTRIEHARSRCRKLKGEVAYDFRVSTEIARKACLAMCQRATRHGIDAVTSETLDRTRSENLVLKDEIRRLKEDRDKQQAGRLFLLEEKIRSRGTIPSVSPEPPIGKSKMRNLQERRGKPMPSPPSAFAAEVRANLLIPEIVMGSAAREEVEPPRNRFLSPMAHYAAANLQVMGVLQDLVEFLRGPECRLAALRGRPRPALVPGGGRGFGVGLGGPEGQEEEEEAEERGPTRRSPADRPQTGVRTCNKCAHGALRSRIYIRVHRVWAP